MSEMGLTELKSRLRLEALGENAFLCLFQLLEATHLLRFEAPCIFKARNSQ